MNENVVEFLATLGKFKPWATKDGRSPQRDFIKGHATHKVRILRAGNRCGKTHVSAWDHVAYCCGMHPFARNVGPVKGWVVGLDWSQAIGGVLWPKIKSFLPPNQVRSISYMRRAAPEIPTAVVFKNGSEMHFRSAEAGRDKLQGAALNFVWIDEEVEAGIVEECRARLLDYGGMLSVTLTPVTSMKWIADLEGEKDRQGRLSSLVIRASMRDAMEAGILDRTQVESFLSNLPEWKRKLRELGDFVTAEGLVYPEFNRVTHCLKPKNGGLYDADGRWMYPWPLPRHWQRFAAMDFGYVVPTAVVIVAIDPDTERAIVERVLYANGIRASRWGAELKAGLLPRLEAPLITDHDAMERAELAAHGIGMCTARKDVIPGIEACERALLPAGDGRPRTMFVLADDRDAPKNHLTGRDDAHFLVWELERYRYKEKSEKGPDVRDEPVKKDDHACDAWRYLAYFLERRHGSAPPSGLVVPPRENPFGDLTPPSPWR